MITLKPIKDTDRINMLFSENGLIPDSVSGCVEARERDELLGYSLYSLTDDGMTVYKIHPEGDIMLADGILRSTLHVAAERSVMNAFYSDGTEEIARKLGFIINADEKRLDINMLFKSCSGCNK